MKQIFWCYKRPLIFQNLFRCMQKSMQFFSSLDVKKMTVLLINYYSYALAGIIQNIYYL